MAELLGPILECMKALWMLDDFYSILDPDGTIDGLFQCKHMCF